MSRLFSFTVYTEMTDRWSGNWLPILPKRFSLTWGLYNAILFPLSWRGSSDGSGLSAFVAGAVSWELFCAGSFGVWGVLYRTDTKMALRLTSGGPVDAVTWLGIATPQ